jgi:hypothetical protein
MVASTPALCRVDTSIIKDNDGLTDVAIQKVYDDMISFDPERAEVVMNLIITRHREAERAFRSFLDEIRDGGGESLPKFSAA